MRDNVLMWRPQAAALRLVDGETWLWSMCKGEQQVDCRLEDRRTNGWTVCFRINRQWSFSLRFGSWSEAVAAADDKHATLVGTGWNPRAHEAAVLH